MNKKRLVSMLFVSTLAFGSMSAQTSMVAYGEDGKYWTFDINKVEKVTFENKSLVFYTTQRNAIDLTKIQSIKFVDLATAIKPQVSTLGGNLSLLRRGNRNYLYARFFFLSNLSLLTIKCVFAFYQM